MFLEYFLCNACVVFSPTFFNIYQCDWIKLKKGLHNHENSFWIRLRSIGKSDLDFEIHTSDFTIEREIRKRISPPRNPSSMWLPTKKSKSGFRWFPYFPFDWEIQKLFPWTVVFFQLIMRARARPLSLRTVLKILPKISQKKKEGKDIQEKISQCWNPFSDMAFDFKSEIRIHISQSNSTSVKSNFANY